MALAPALGWGAAAFVVAVVGAALAALIGAAPATDAPWFDARLIRVAAFSVWQAALSALLSLGVGLIVARALARRRFPGRAIVLRLFGLPLVVPVVVAVLGLVVVWGRNGWVNDLLAATGLPTMRSLYGLHGILIAHVFFNMPLVVRLLLVAWATIPAENWRLASELGLSSRQTFRLVEWPALRGAVPGAVALVFLLCFTSFGVVLTLGGGPRATILEVAIYQALRLDFDLERAVVLALAQIALGALFVSASRSLRRALPLGPSLERPWARSDTVGPIGRLADGAIIGLAIALVASPLLATTARAAAAPLAAVLAEPGLWRAAARSLAVGLVGGGAATALGVAVALGARHCRNPRAGAAIEAIGVLTLVVSPLVLGAGLFVLALPAIGSAAVALALVALVSALMTMPYAVGLVGAGLAARATERDRLCTALGVTGWNRLRLVDLPAVRRPIGLAYAIAASLSAGDLGAIALFGNEDSETLALRLYRQLAGYRLDEASITALVLVGLAFALFFIIERGIGGRGDA
jgi:thiamine transport system permease protein